MNEVLSERHLAKEVKRWGKCWACGGEKSRQDLSSLMCKNSRIWGKANVCLWLSGKHLFDVLLRCSAKQETQQCLAGVAAKQDDFLLVLGLQKTTLTVYFLAFTKYIFSCPSMIFKLKIQCENAGVKLCAALRWFLFSPSAFKFLQRFLLEARKTIVFKLVITFYRCITKNFHTGFKSI